MSSYANALNLNRVMMNVLKPATMMFNAASFGCNLSICGLMSWNRERTV